MIHGIDLNSRSIALCTYTDEGRFVRVGKFGVPLREMRRPVILSELYDFAKQVGLPGDRVYVEEPIVAGARNIQSSLKVAMAYGVTLAALHSTRCVVTPVPVSLWKVATVGKGNASKSDVASWLHSQHAHVHRECTRDQDKVDASCIALYGLSLEKEACERRRALRHQAEDPQDPRHGHDGD